MVGGECPPDSGVHGRFLASDPTASGGDELVEPAPDGIGEGTEGPEDGVDRGEAPQVFQHLPDEQVTGVEDQVGAVQLAVNAVGQAAPTVPADVRVGHHDHMGHIP